MLKRVGINGFGRIGRNFLRAGFGKVDICAINDLPFPITSLSHLLKYDSLMGIYKEDVSVADDYLLVAGKKIKVFSQPNPSKIEWNKMGIDIVVEAVGLFTEKKKAAQHLKHGVKKVIITAPAQKEDITIIMGVNEKEYIPRKHHIISPGSCTVNCLVPVLKIINDNLGVEGAFMTTVHCYTQNQRLVDSPHKDLRRARMAGINMIPTETTAIESAIKVLPELEGKIKGLAIRVPIPNVSLIELMCNTKKTSTKKELNEIFKSACRKNKQIGYTEVPLVSIDFLHDKRSAIIAGDLTEIVGSKMIHVVAWYNNEWAYANRLVELVEFIQEKSFQVIDRKLGLLLKDEL